MWCDAAFDARLLARTVSMANRRWLSSESRRRLTGGQEKLTQTGEHALLVSTGSELIAVNSLDSKNDPLQVNKNIFICVHTISTNNKTET